MKRTLVLAALLGGAAVAGLALQNPRPAPTPSAPSVVALKAARVFDG